MFQNPRHSERREVWTSLFGQRPDRTSDQLPWSCCEQFANQGMGQGPSTSTLTGASVSESAEIRGRPTDPVHWHDRGCASGVSTPSARSPMDCRRTTDVLWFFIEAVARVAAKMPCAGCECQGLRPSQLEPFVYISTAHMLESTEVSAVPVEVVEVKTSVEEPPFPVQATAPFAQCKSSSYLLWPPGRPGRLQPGVNCLWPFRRSIIRFSLRCRHSLRLQRAATERDGVRCFAQQV